MAPAKTIAGRASRVGSDVALCRNLSYNEFHTKTEISTVANENDIRIILFAGKGGVGKTSVAGATGIKTAQLGKKTLIMSLDAAHSLADIFDLDRDLMDKNRGEPVQVADNLWIRELDIQEEIHKHWGEVYKYFTALLNTTGFDEVLAEELAIIPGMEEVSSLLYINTYAREHEYDVILLDCAPTGESLRFVSIPTALEWYIKKLFNMERRMAKVIRPVAKHLTDIPLPQDEYFAALERLFKRLEGVETLLSDPNITTVRLVTNPEKIVIKETQRAFMYFCLYRMCIDAVIINRILPDDVNERFFDEWKNSQMRYVKRAEEYFSPVPIYEAQLFREEVLGKEALSRLADSIYGDRDPTEIFYRELPYDIVKVDSTYRITIKLPFVKKQDVELNRVADELIIRVGSFKRSILLPKQATASNVAKAAFNGDKLIVSLGGMEDVR